MPDEDPLSLLRARLLSSLRRRAGAYSDSAEDMVQETLVRVLAKYPELEHRKDAAPLAYGFARKVVLEVMRERQKYECLGEDDAKLVAEPPGGPTWDARERCLSAAMAKLPRDCNALLQAMLKGWKNEALAEVHDITVNTLYQRQHRCFRAVREIMKTTAECEGICHA